MAVGDTAVMDVGDQERVAVVQVRDWPKQIVSCIIIMHEQSPVQSEANPVNQDEADANPANRVTRQTLVVRSLNFKSYHKFFCDLVHTSNGLLLPPLSLPVCLLFDWRKPSITVYAQSDI